MINTNQTGVYMIKNKISGKFYIGSASLSFRKRMALHRVHLRRGTHDSRHMQNAWNKYGEDDFAFSVLVVCAKDMCLFYEQLFLDALNPTYNTAKIAGNCLGVRHSDEVKKSMSVLQRKKRAKHEWKGSLRSLVEIAEMEGIDAKMLNSRVNGLGKLVADAVLMPYKPVERLLTHDGETRSIAGWARYLQASPQAIGTRLSQGQTIADCVRHFESTHKRMSVPEYCKISGIPYGTVYNRLKRGMPISDASSCGDIRTTIRQLKEAA